MEVVFAGFSLLLRPLAQLARSGGLGLVSASLGLAPSGLVGPAAAGVAAVLRSHAAPVLAAAPGTTCALFASCARRSRSSHRAGRRTGRRSEWRR